LPENSPPVGTLGRVTRSGTVSSLIDALCLKRLDFTTSTSIRTDRKTCFRYEAAFGHASHHAAQVGDAVGADRPCAQARIEFVEQCLGVRGPGFHEAQDRRSFIGRQSGRQHERSSRRLDSADSASGGFVTWWCFRTCTSFYRCGGFGGTVAALSARLLWRFRQDKAAGLPHS
jgi:hypothetical protein